MSLNVGMSIWDKFFSRENTPEESTGPHKSSFSLYKQVSERNGDHEWPMLSYCVIYFEKFREGSFTGRIVVTLNCMGLS